MELRFWGIILSHRPSLLSFPVHIEGFPNRGNPIPNHGDPQNGSASLGKVQHTALKSAGQSPRQP